MMRRDRRRFLRAGLGAVAAAGAAQRVMAEDGDGEGMDCLDYGASFICGTAKFNAVRFWVESRTVLWDEQDGTRQEFYQCASCKSENTFAESDLFAEDNYDFLPILGGRDWLIFRRPNRISESYRKIQRDVWGEPRLKLRAARDARELETFEAIRDATAEAVPIVAQTEIADEATGLRAMIEYPVKTMNISLEKSLYQVDTGPVAVPDLTKRYEPALDSLRLAFVAFNAAEFADFVVEQPTAVTGTGESPVEVYHFSQPFSMAARNRLWALG